MRHAPDLPICVIGAGPGGLGAAMYLQRAGYRRITVLEREARVGGKCCSPVVDGQAYDMGALEITPEYTRVRELVQRYGLQTTGIGSLQLVDQVSGTRHGAGYASHGLSLPDQVEMLVDLLRYRFQLWRDVAAVQGPGFGTLAPELTQPMSAWLAQHGMAELGRLFALPVTCYGYGLLSQVPAAYVLKYLDAVNFRMLVTDALKADFGRGGAWPQRITTGYQSLMQGVADEVAAVPGSRVLTGVDVQAVKRDGAPDAPVELRYLHRGVTVTERFGALVMAGLLTSDAMGFMDLDAEEQAVFSQVRLAHYATTLCRVHDVMDHRRSGMRDGTLAMTVKDGAISDPPDGGVCMIIKPPVDSDWCVAYTVSSRPLTEDAVRQQVEGHLRAMHFDLREIGPTQVWHYFPHFDSAALAAGVDARLRALMGHRHTHWAGGLMNFEDVERCFEWSEHLVATGF